MSSNQNSIKLKLDIPIALNSPRYFLSHALCMTPPPAIYPMTKMKKDDLNCLTCSATHICMNNWRLEIVFSDPRSNAPSRAQIEALPFRLVQSKVRRASVQINCQLSMRAQLFRQFPVFPISIFHFPTLGLPHHVSQLKARKMDCVEGEGLQFLRSFQLPSST